MYGSIRITPYTDAAPVNSKLVLELAAATGAAGDCPTCNFYRHEHIPPASPCLGIFVGNREHYFSYEGVLKLEEFD